MLFTPQVLKNGVKFTNKLFKALSRKHKSVS